MRLSFGAPIRSFLDDETREAWEVKLGLSTSYPSLKEFKDFVTGYTCVWESLASTSIKTIIDKGPLGSSWISNKSNTKS